MADQESLPSTSEDALNQVRRKCLTRGKSGLSSFGLAFRNFDKDYSRQITFREFQEGLKQFDISMDSKLETELFSRFDVDRSGNIDFQEFMNSLSPPLTGKRMEVVKSVFNKLDESGDGVLQMEDLLDRFKDRAKRHPKFQSGEWTERDVIQNLLVGFEQPDSQDGVVTLTEFLNYYSTVSVCVQDDAYFEKHLKACWGIQ